MRFFWRKRRRAVIANVYGPGEHAKALRALLYEYAELRATPRVPFFGRNWMPKGVRTADEALLLTGRRQVIELLERVAGLSPAQLDALDGVERGRDIDVESE